MSDRQPKPITAEYLRGQANRYERGVTSGTLTALVAAARRIESLAAERDRLAARLAEVRGVRNELENSAAAAGLSDAGGAYRRAVRLLDAALLPVGEPAEEEET